jgi:hypothetical protein
MVEFQNTDEYKERLNRTMAIMQPHFKNFFDVYGLKDFETECFWHLMPFALIFLWVAFWVKMFGLNRALQEATGACFQLALLCTIHLFWRHRPQCSDSAACYDFKDWSFNSFTLDEWIWTGLAIWGCSVWSCIWTGVLWFYSKKVAYYLNLVAEPLFYYGMGGVVYTDASIEDLIKGHVPMLLGTALTCLALTQPNIVCGLECFATYVKFCFQIGFCFAMASGIVFGVIPAVWLVLAVIDTACLNSYFSNRLSKIQRDLQPSPFVRSLAIRAPPAAKVVQDKIMTTKDHIAKLPNIAAWNDPNDPNYKGSLRGEIAIVEHFEKYCTVQGRKATQADLVKVLEDAKLQNTATTRKWYAWKLMAHLGKMQPFP